MKHNMKIPVIAAAVMELLTVTGCDNSQYRLENLYPEEYHKIISFQDDAVSTDIMKIYDINIDITETVTLLRGGSDPSLKAVARLRPMTAEEAETYLTSGTALDPQYYSIRTPEIVLEPEERYKSVEIVFSAENIAGIRDAMSSASGTPFCLALMLDGLDGTSVNADKSYFVREIELGKPEITVTGSSLTDNPDSWSTDLSAMMDGDNIWDFSCRLLRDDSYIENYNYSTGGNYNALPEGTKVNFSGNGQLDFISGNHFSQNSVTLTVSKEGFDFDNAPYVLPVVLNMGELDFEMANPYYMVIEGVITLTEDMLSCPFDLSGYDGQGLAGLIDGNLYDTYWHTPYNDDAGGYYFNEDYGHYFDIDLGKEVSKIKCRYYNRPGQESNWPKDIELYIGNDGENWTLLGSRTDIPVEDQTVELGPFDSEEPFSYLRISIKKNQQDLRPGVDDGACSHMCEFQLFGI